MDVVILICFFLAILVVFIYYFLCFVASGCIY
jgi:hypothetical protein